MRAALDTYGVPYTYFADIKLREGNLRAKYDVIIFPHVGGNAAVAGQRHPEDRRDAAAVQEDRRRRRTSACIDQTDDIRGGMGWEGLMELVKFVQAGRHADHRGLDVDDLPGVQRHDGRHGREPDGLFVRGSMMRGVVADRRSPIAYGYDAQVPVYFNQAPVLNAGGGGGGFGGGGGGDAIPGVGHEHARRWRRAAAAPVDVRSGEPGVAGSAGARRRRGQAAAAAAAAARGGGGGRGGFGGGDAAETAPARGRCRSRPIPTTCCCRASLVGGQALAGRAQVVDAPLGKGHVVMFAIRPFWRWQTQGTFFLGFNAILNWNDLDAGRAAAPRPTTAQ